MKKFYNFIKELFNTKSYSWLNNNLVTFTRVEKYYVQFDSIGHKAYHLSFYYINENGEKIIDLVDRDDNSVYSILSNVKHCILEFVDKNDVDYLGYYTFDKERDDLYFRFLKILQRKGDVIKSMKKKNKIYYILYKKEISMEEHLYTKRLTIEEDKK